MVDKYVKKTQIKSAAKLVKGRIYTDRLAINLWEYQVVAGKKFPPTQ